MKIKHHLRDLIDQRDSLVSFLRAEDTALTMEQTLNLCGEITSLTDHIKCFLDMPYRKGEEEMGLYQVQYESKMNRSVEIPRKRPKKKVPVIPSTTSGLSFF